MYNPAIILLRAPNPPSRVATVAARSKLVGRQRQQSALSQNTPAQSGFSTLRRPSAGRVFVFQFRPCSAPLWPCGHLALWRLALRAFGSLHFGSPHFGFPHFGSPHFGSPHFGSPHFGSPHFGSPHVGVAEMRGTETRETEMRETKMRRTKMRGAERPKGRPPQRQRRMPSGAEHGARLKPKTRPALGLRRAENPD